MAIILPEVPRPTVPASIAGAGASCLDSVSDERQSIGVGRLGSWYVQEPAYVEGTLRGLQVVGSIEVLNQGH